MITWRIVPYVRSMIDNIFIFSLNEKVPTYEWEELHTTEMIHRLNLIKKTFRLKNLKIFINYDIINCLIMLKSRVTDITAKDIISNYDNLMLFEFDVRIILFKKIFDDIIYRLHSISSRY